MQSLGATNNLDGPNSPQAPIMPFKKMHTTHPKKHHKPKVERGRRACSEPPTARTELANLTTTGNNGLDNADEDQVKELDKLEAKLTSPGEGRIYHN
jgi:hypothetical protein